MVKALNDLCCRVCGAKFTSRDDIEEDAYGTGFWCPECDGYTPYENSNRSSNIDLSVCLETKAVKVHESESRKPKSLLQERISPLRYCSVCCEVASKRRRRREAFKHHEISTLIQTPWSAAL